MTGKELRYLRESRGLTRDQLAKELVDCTASGIVKWESGVSPVPSWVAAAMFKEVPLTLPLEELHALLDRARTDGVSFTDLLTRAIREYLAQGKPAAPTVNEGPASLTAEAADSPSSIIDLPPQHIVAEEPKHYQTRRK